MDDAKRLVSYPLYSSRCIHTSLDGTTEGSVDGEILGSFEGKILGSSEGSSDGFKGKS